MTEVLCLVQAKRTKKTRSGNNDYSNYGNYRQQPTKTETAPKEKKRCWQSPVTNTPTMECSAAADNSSYNSIDTTLPITVVPSTGGGLLDSVRPSLRNDAPFEAKPDKRTHAVGVRKPA